MKKSKFLQALKKAQHSSHQMTQDRLKDMTPEQQVRWDEVRQKHKSDKGAIRSMHSEAFHHHERMAKYHQYHYNKQTREHSKVAQADREAQYAYRDNDTVENHGEMVQAQQRRLKVYNKLKNHSDQWSKHSKMAELHMHRRHAGMVWNNKEFKADKDAAANDTPIEEKHHDFRPHPNDGLVSKRNRIKKAIKDLSEENQVKWDQQAEKHGSVKATAKHMSARHFREEHIEAAKHHLQHSDRHAMAGSMSGAGHKHAGMAHKHFAAAHGHSFDARVWSSQAQNDWSIFSRGTPHGRGGPKNEFVPHPHDHIINDLHKSVKDLSEDNQVKWDEHREKHTSDKKAAKSFSVHHLHEEHMEAAKYHLQHADNAVGADHMLEHDDLSRQHFGAARGHSGDHMKWSGLQQSHWTRFSASVPHGVKVKKRGTQFKPHRMDEFLKMHKSLVKGLHDLPSEKQVKWDELTAKHKNTKDAAKEFSSSHLKALHLKAVKHHLQHADKHYDSRLDDDAIMRRRRGATESMHQNMARTHWAAAHGHSHDLDDWTQDQHNAFKRNLTRVAIGRGRPNKEFVPHPMDDIIHDLHKSLHDLDPEIQVKWDSIRAKHKHEEPARRELVAHPLVSKKHEEARDHHLSQIHHHMSKWFEHSDAHDDADQLHGANHRTTRGHRRKIKQHEKAWNNHWNMAAQHHLASKGEKPEKGMAHASEKRKNEFNEHWEAANKKFKAVKNTSTTTEFTPHPHDKMVDNEFLHKALPEDIPLKHQMAWDEAAGKSKSGLHSEAIKEFRKNPKIKEAHMKAFAHHNAHYNMHEHADSEHHDYHKMTHMSHMRKHYEAATGKPSWRTGGQVSSHPDFIQAYDVLDRKQKHKDKEAQGGQRFTAHPHDNLLTDKEREDAHLQKSKPGSESIHAVDVYEVGEVKGERDPAHRPKYQRGDIINRPKPKKKEVKKSKPGSNLWHDEIAPIGRVIEGVRETLHEVGETKEESIIPQLPKGRRGSQTKLQQMKKGKLEQKALADLPHEHQVKWDEISERHTSPEAAKKAWREHAHGAAAQHHWDRYTSHAKMSREHAEASMDAPDEDSMNHHDRKNTHHADLAHKHWAQFSGHHVNRHGDTTWTINRTGESWQKPYREKQQHVDVDKYQPHDHDNLIDNYHSLTKSAEREALESLPSHHQVKWDQLVGEHTTPEDAKKAYRKHIHGEAAQHHWDHRRHHENKVKHHSRERNLDQERHHDELASKHWQHFLNHHRNSKGVHSSDPFTSNMNHNWQDERDNYDTKRKPVLATKEFRGHPNDGLINHPHSLSKAMPKDLHPKHQVAWDQAAENTPPLTQKPVGKQRAHDAVIREFRKNPKIKEAHLKAMRHHAQLDTDHFARGQAIRNNNDGSWTEEASKHYSASVKHHNAFNAHYNALHGSVKGIREAREHLKDTRKKPKTKEFTPHKHDALISDHEKRVWNVEGLSKALPHDAHPEHQMHWDEAAAKAKPRRQGEELTHEDVIHEFRKHPKIKEMHQQAFEHHATMSGRHQRKAAHYDAISAQHHGPFKHSAQMEAKHNNLSGEHHDAARAHFRAANDGEPYGFVDDFAHHAHKDEHIVNHTDFARHEGDRLLSEKEKEERGIAHHLEKAHIPDPATVTKPSKTKDEKEDASYMWRGPRTGQTKPKDELADAGDLKLEVIRTQPKPTLGKALPQDVPDEHQMHWDETAGNVPMGTQHHKIVKKFRQNSKVKQAHHEAMEHHVLQAHTHWNSKDMFRKRSIEAKKKTTSEKNFKAWEHHGLQSERHWEMARKHYQAATGKRSEVSEHEDTDHFINTTDSVKGSKGDKHPMHTPFQAHPHDGMLTQREVKHAHKKAVGEYKWEADWAKQRHDLHVSKLKKAFDPKKIHNAPEELQVAWDDHQQKHGKEGQKQMHLKAFEHHMTHSKRQGWLSVHTENAKKFREHENSRQAHWKHAYDHHVEAHGKEQGAAGISNKMLNDIHNMGSKPYKDAGEDSSSHFKGHLHDELLEDHLQKSGKMKKSKFIKLINKYNTQKRIKNMLTKDEDAITKPKFDLDSKVKTRGRRGVIHDVVHEGHPMYHVRYEDGTKEWVRHEELESTDE